MEQKTVRIPKTIISENNKAGVIMLLDFNLYYLDTITKKG